MHILKEVHKICTREKVNLKFLVVYSNILAIDLT